MMSEMITGEQLEASSGKWSSNPASCNECGWTGDSEDLTCKLTSGVSGLKKASIYVCPDCGSEEIDGDD